MERKEIQAFIEYLYENEKSEHTIEKYERDVKQFYRYLKDAPLEKKAVREYKRTDERVCLALDQFHAGITKQLLSLHRKRRTADEKHQDPERSICGRAKELKEERISSADRSSTGR